MHIFEKNTQAPRNYEEHNITLKSELGEVANNCAHRDVLKAFEEDKSFFDARVKNGIELYRKGTARIRVLDENGEPLRGATVKVKQTCQAFKFGANLFHIDELETPEKNNLFKEKFAELFNLATIPFYWDTLEPEQGKPRFDVGCKRIYRRPSTDLCLDWCHKQGIEPKLHCLNMDRNIPEWLNGTDVETFELKRLLSKRFKEIAERYADDIPMVEVINETLHKGVSDFFFSDEFCEWSFREARRHFPANKLIINEGNIQWNAPVANTSRNPYYMLIKSLLDKNVQLDAIGLQYHSNTPVLRAAKEYTKEKGRYSPRYMFSIMDKFAELNLPMQITEITIPAYGPSEEDEAVQADLLRYVYSMFFSQKNMEAIIYWNIPDGYHIGAEPGDMTRGWNAYYNGIIRYDMSEKPSFKALKKLIRDEWITNTQIVTDDEGYADFRGFHGDYELTVISNDRTYKQSFKMSCDDLKNAETISLS